METKDFKPSLQDFSLISTTIKQFGTDFSLTNDSISFMFFTLDCILGLQDDEIEESITDNYYLQTSGKESGHDRGIDAIYIDESEKTVVIHLFNCKYTNQFKNLNNNFPAGEIDKICGFFTDLVSQDEDSFKNVNKRLKEKISEIWDIYKTQNPKYVIHICSNQSLGFEESEKLRLENFFNKYSGITIQYHQLSFFITRLTKEGKQKVNAKLRAIDQNIFEKSDGDVRALIVDIDARELLRIVLNNEELRNNVSLENYEVIKEQSILEDAFEDNVRVYLKQRSRINRNIKETALSDNAHRFFYFNNGITLICNHFEYPKNARNPIIELEALQIVNGSQTIHALHEAYMVNSDKFNNIELLLRIYETHKEELTIKIAEYTNSQNPVSSRDIRSVDVTQLKLAKELEILGYFYERKKGQYFGKLKSKRIDAEKAGQALTAFFNKLPAEAKNDKKSIFSQKYDDVFTDEITSDSILLATRLFNEIESRKKQELKKAENDSNKYSEIAYLRYANYYVMYALSELADKNNIVKNEESFEAIINLYDEALALIKLAIKEEKASYSDKTKYLDSAFFKTNKPKMYIQKFLKK